MEATNNTAALERAALIRQENLDPDRYFLSLLEEASRLGLISSSRSDQIMLECAALLAERTQRFTAGDSLSVTVERAKSLLDSSLYTIGAYLATLPHQDQVQALNSQPISQLFEKGLQAAAIQFRRAKRLLSTISDDLVQTDNIAYNDTLSRGIPPFFRKYDHDYEAHCIPASIDYPLCGLCGPCRGQGAAFMLEYLRRIYLENRFCLEFPAPLIDEVLRGGDPGFCHLLTNLFEAILTNAIGCVLTETNPMTLNPPRDRLPRLREGLLSLDSGQTTLLLREAAARLLRLLDLEDMLEDYVLPAAEGLAVSIQDAAQRDLLDRMFPAPREDRQESTMLFQDNPTMSDEEFRTFFEQLQTCRHSTDRVAILQGLNSLQDLSDALSGGALTGKECPLLFQALDDSALALLARQLPTDYGCLELHFTAGEEEWLSALQEYLNHLDSERRNSILALAQSFNAM